MGIRTWLALGAVVVGVGAVVHAAPSPYQTALARWRAFDRAVHVRCRAGSSDADDDVFLVDGVFVHHRGAAGG